MPDERLQILLVAPETTGGIGRHVSMLAGGLVARGHQVRVVAPAATLERLGLPEGVARAVVPVGSARSAARLAGVLRDLAVEVDVVHGHGVRIGAQLALARLGRPLVVTWHNAPIGGVARRIVHTSLEQVSARGSDVVLGASEDLVARARAAGAAAARLCPVVAPAPDEPVPPRPQQPPVVLAVARLHPQKRLDLLVEAAAEWAGRVRVVVAGDGPLRQELERQASALGAPVTFLGDRSDVADLLATASVVALPSDWEARPLVAQEALRAGIPLVATAVGGVPELVGDAALLVPAGDAVALRTAIERVLDDADLRARLAAAGAERARAWPGRDEMLDIVVRAYRDAVSRQS